MNGGCTSWKRKRGQRSIAVSDFPLLASSTFHQSPSLLSFTMIFPLTILAPVALSVLTAVRAASVERRATTCNGHSELCNKSFGNVTFVGAHDSYAVGTNNLATNQDYNVTQQLNDGIRMLQMQAHNQSGVIQLCHTSCALFNGGTLENYLNSVKTWMGANTNDVVSLLIVNSDGFTPSDFDSVFKSVGLDTISYAPASSSLTYSSWPTLGSMIDSGKHLVTFLDTGADFTSVAYLIDEFTNIWETAFDVTDTTFDCNVNRTKGDTSTQMYLINHFLDTLVLGQPAPDSSRANTTNAVSGTGSLGLQVETCAAEHSRNPNFMLVDFYEYGGGSVFQVAAAANGVTYSPATPVPSPITTSSTTSSASSSSGAISAFRISDGHVGALMTISAGLLAGVSGEYAASGCWDEKETRFAARTMSFQNFRLDGVPIQHIPQQPPQPPQTFTPHQYTPPAQSVSTPLQVATAPDPQFQLQTVDGGSRGSNRGPYGSGDMNDGYTLVFENMDSFQVWRLREESEKMVEFVKGDTHGSKAVPPRFKDHVKLVCARHSRSGRKKYVKKFPDRVRKVPSRKLEGRGCPASISYKTYFDTEEIRVCYVSQHSHEVGLANLPYTRRGRRAAAAGADPEAGLAESSSTPQPNASTSSISHALTPAPPIQYASTPLQSGGSPPMRAQPPQHPNGFSPYPHFPSMSMPAPPGLGTLPAQPPAPVDQTDRGRMERERWDRLETLFLGIRGHARHFEYPPPSVAALESVLMRMYFESPVQAPAQPMPMMTLPLQSQPQHQQHEGAGLVPPVNDSVQMDEGGPSESGSGEEQDEE
ncbi:hypothetical protein EW146_g2060 [Bondarzewia mesenterica]|uniref:Uncharacterized protein n=1 Tax=Bondarzewia mesenterica TaxID=1095465 RepID=A0A4S4M453_9AGAM|nr:hypothetical protein EW146_g2060 [Bondarzewia mesenterica]